MVPIEIPSFEPRQSALFKLPRELISHIGSFLYNPLELTQDDRLSWNIFASFGDNESDRRQELSDLINFGSSCRAIWKEVRPIMFRCIRTPEIDKINEVIERHNDWGRHVKSLIIDLSAFEDEVRRNPW
jgi:hypothetical protein